MVDKKGIYFVADVHLGLQVNDPEAREKRFIKFLKEIPRESTAAVFLLGDIWDYWYEYHDVIPRMGVRVVSELIQLMDDGVEVWYVPGNHDIWCYNFFESIGIRKVEQPYFTEFGGKTFCLGHGDRLGGAKWGYRFMLGVFHNKVMQAIFSSLHPWLGFRIGLHWSNGHRRKHTPYHFGQQDEPLLHYAEQVSSERHIDYFIFGHFHDSVDRTLSTGSRFLIVEDWIKGGSPYLYFDGTTVLGGHSQNME